MRAALISIAGQPRDAASGTALALAGKSLARRQLDFALAAGAERIVLLGDGGAPEAIALRHAAEGAGAKVQVIGNGHGLLGAVRAADELLVLASGLLPESPDALELLGKRALLVLPAASGAAAGFERIDLERAWAGALVASGAEVERLAELAPDSEPTAALLRIALQTQVPEKRLPEASLADGSWAMLDASGAVEAERAWLARNLSPPPPGSLSGWLAHRLLRLLAPRLLGRMRELPVLQAAVVVLMAGAVSAAVFGLAPLGFALVALMAVAGQLAGGLVVLATAPYEPDKRSRFALAGLALVVDLTLAACAIAAIEQDALHRIFPPFVLTGLLRALRAERWPGWAALAGDRMLLAGVLALAAAFGAAEPAVMALALIMIALQAAQSARQTRITRA